MYTLIFTGTQLPLEGHLFPSYKVGHLKRIYLLFIFITALQAGTSVQFTMGSLRFFKDLIHPATLGPGINSSSNRNEYPGYILRGKGDQCIRLTTLAPSYADYLEILGFSPSWSLKGLSGPVMEELNVYLHLFLILTCRLQFE